MKILLIKEPGDPRDKLSFALESKYNAIVESVDGADPLAAAAKAIAIAAHNAHPFDLMIYDLQGVPLTRLEHFQAQTEATPTILCHDGQALQTQATMTWNVLGTADRATLLTSLFQIIDRHRPEAETVDETANASNFCKIRSKILLSVCPLRGDIFIRLSESKYVKLFLEGDHFEQSDWIKYTEKKGVEYLYIKIEQCQQFIEKYRIDLEKYLKKSLQLDMAKATEIQNSVHETVQEMGQKIGFTKDVQIVAKNQIRIALKVLKKSPGIAGLLQKIENEKGLYISSHSTMTGYIASAIAAFMEWGSDATMYKLNLAAFLHDITLENHDLAQYSSKKSVENGNFTDLEKKNFLEHPMAAAKIAQGFTEVPPDVDTIILQHHEWADGSGFPRGINHAYISPLSSIFIVAHEMADQILKTGSGFSIEKFVSETSEKFARGNFKKVLEAVKQIRLDK